MVIAVGACDNVEWGGIDFAVVPPPPHAADTATAVSVTPLRDDPVLFYVHRDTGDLATVIPVAQIGPAGLTRLGADDIDAFADRFIDTFLAAGQELALFRRGRRVGTLTVDSAGVPTEPVCRPLPRAAGRLQLASGAGAVTEFLALAGDDAPESRDLGVPEPVRSMEVVSDMVAGEMLRGRELSVPTPTRARRQLVPFPLSDTDDPGFAATYLVDDTLGLGGDDTGAALFVVFTPRGQTGYDTAFVGFANYSTSGKAAPRVIDFLDWDDDGVVELLLEVFGVRTSWFRAAGRADGEWQAIFEDRCDPRTAQVGVDTSETPAEAAPAPSRPAPAPPQRTQPRATPTQRDASLDSIPIIEPTIQLSNPRDNPRVRRDTSTRDTVPPDTGGVAG